MIRHYLTIARQAAVLEERLPGRVLAECWSQQKNELFLRFIDASDSLFLEISLDLRIGYALLRREAARARRNTIDFFAAAIGARVEHVTIDDGERIVRIHLSGDFVLAIVLFGAGSGNVLLLKDGDVVDAFHRYAGEHDALLADAATSPHRTREGIAAAVRGSDDPLARALGRAIPELGRRLADEAVARAGVAPDRTGASVSEAELTALLRHVDELYEQCSTGQHVYLYHMPDELVFALTPMHGLEPAATRIQNFEDIAEAVRVYRSTWYRTRSVESTRSAMLRALGTERARLERLLVRQRTSEEHGSRAEEYEKAGTLLVSHLHAVESGVASVTLTDFDGSARTLALEPTLTPAQNVERLFARARKTREAAARAVQQAALTERRLRTVEALAASITGATTMEELDAIRRTNTELLRMDREPKEMGSPDRYRRFTVVGGLEVFAGKSAANNDELTVRFARPNDYWFHARGTSGSHVVLRWGDAKSKPPKEAIRAAASIAAYYSGAKNAKMVPVAYTLKKHVRKPRGAAIGAVVMEREEVIMAEPRLPAGMED